MWPLFGIVTLLGSGIFLFYRRMQRPWEGKSGSIRGLPYAFNTIALQGRIIRLSIGIDVASCFDFSFQPETAIDRLCKRLGLANEHQTGRQEFDEAIYVVSDDRPLLDALSQSENLHRWVLALFSSQANYRLQGDSVHCRGGRLWLELRRGGNDVHEEEITGVADVVVPLLHNIADSLHSLSTPLNRIHRDPFIRPAIFLLAISGAMAISGAVHLARIHMSGREPYIVDLHAFWIHATLLGTVIISSLLVIAIKLLGRSARTHLIMLEIITVGYFGAIASSAAMLRDLNMELNQDIGIYYDTSIEYRYFEQRSKQTIYFISLNDWNNPGMEFKRRVSQEFYRRASKGDIMRVWQRPGALGYRWVVSMTHRPD